MSESEVQMSILWSHIRLPKLHENIFDEKSSNVEEVTNSGEFKFMNICAHEHVFIDTVYEEHAILLFQRDRTMVAYGKIHFEV